MPVETGLSEAPWRLSVDTSQQGGIAVDDSTASLTASWRGKG